MPGILPNGGRDSNDLDCRLGESGANSSQGISFFLLVYSTTGLAVGIRDGGILLAEGGRYGR